MSQTLELEWTGPHRLPNDLVGQNRLPEYKGIYVWTIDQSDGYYVHYIGYSANVRWRQLEHVVNTLGGLYPIPTTDRDSITKNEYIPDSLFNEAPSSYEGTYKRAKWIYDHPDNAGRILREYLRAVAVFVAESDDARTAEYLLQQHFQSLKKANDPRAVFCTGLSLRGSKRVGPANAVSSTVAFDGKPILGITDQKGIAMKLP